MEVSEKLSEREEIKKRILELRASGIRYEQMALEIGLSLDTIRRFLYTKNRVPAEITMLKIKNWLKQRETSDVL